MPSTVVKHRSSGKVTSWAVTVSEGVVFAPAVAEIVPQSVLSALRGSGLIWHLILG